MHQTNHEPALALAIAVLHVDMGSLAFWLAAACFARHGDPCYPQTGERGRIKRLWQAGRRRSNS